MNNHHLEGINLTFKFSVELSFKIMKINTEVELNNIICDDYLFWNCRDILFLDNVLLYNIREKIKSKL